MKRVFLATVVMFMVGCSDDTKQSTQVAQKEAVVKEEAQKIQAPVVAAKESVAQEVKASQATQETPKTAEVVQEAPKAEAVVAQVAEASIDAAALYQVCSGCHGVDGSKVALGKSQVIKGWSAKKISDALHGYKNGTYGGAMKGLMGAQVSKLSDAQIEALAEHISKL
ncbi:c-type cytochrome [Sulfurimonas sp.]|uniref:c-type cytochrome n=1 Tax=Sulfurimonas sp. TaxID=2022749 RepID=UPI003D0BD7F5